MNIMMSAPARCLLPIIAGVPETHPDYQEAYEREIQKIVDLAREHKGITAPISTRLINGMHIGLSLMRYIDQNSGCITGATIYGEIQHPDFNLFSGMGQITASVPEAHITRLNHEIKRDGFIPLSRITTLPEILPDTLGQLAIVRLSSNGKTLQLMYDADYQPFTPEQA